MTRTARERGAAPTTVREGLLVAALCWLVVVLDGYDLIVYGATIPSLLEEPGWELSPQSAGGLGSAALVGALFGALGAGVLADVIGRRRVILLCTVWFSLWTAACAIAPSPEIFGGFRFLAGLGLGGVLPTVSALTIEYAPKRFRGLVYTAMLSGIPLGGVLASLLATAVIPAWGWRPMYAFAIIALLTVVPIAWRALPESRILASGRVAPLEGVRTVMSPGRRQASLLFPSATFAAMLMWFGLSVWLPQIMLQGGFDLGSALSLLLVLNLGGVAGSLMTAMVADRHGLRRVTIGSFSVAVVVIGLLATSPPRIAIYVLVALAGVCTHGTLCLLNTYVASYYPPPVAATALGWSLGFGRLGAIAGPTIGGFVLASAAGVETSFLLFSAIAVLGGIALGLVPRPPVPRDPTISPTSKPPSGAVSAEPEA